MPLNFCFQFPVHVSLMAARCWCTMSCGEATTKADREARAARARANFILIRDGLERIQAAAIDAQPFLHRFPLPLYTCRESGMFSSRCAINIGVGASFVFLSYTRCQWILRLITRGPRPPGRTSPTILYYGFSYIGTVTELALADGPAPLMLGDDIVTTCAKQGLRTEE